MTVLFALLTAMANAAAVASQHVASTSDQEHSSGWRLIGFLFRHPLWLFGWVALAASLIFQAVALHFGPLSVVQPLLVSELVMALTLRQFWIHQSIRPITWISAVVTSIALAVFLVSAAPSGPSIVPATSAWTAPASVSCVAAGLLVLLGLHGSPSRRAGLFACATAVLWALEATLIKATTDTLTTFGMSQTFSRWPLYAFVVVGIAGLLCEQTALHAGPLKVSQPFIVIVDPIVSIVLGVWLYREHLHAGLLHATMGVAAFAVMSVGVVVLTRTAPASMSPNVHRI